MVPLWPSCGRRATTAQSCGLICTARTTYRATLAMLTHVCHLRPCLPSRPSAGPSAQPTPLGRLTLPAQPNPPARPPLHTHLTRTTQPDCTTPHSALTPPAQLNPIAQLTLPAQLNPPARPPLRTHPPHLYTHLHTRTRLHLTSTSTSAPALASTPTPSHAHTHFRDHNARLKTWQS